MRKLVLFSVVFALALSVVPAMAGDQSINGKDLTTFQALGNMATPASMTDVQLASVEGMSGHFYRGHHHGYGYQSNDAYVAQLNVGGYGYGYQSNDAYVAQLNVGGGYQSNSAAVFQANIR